MRRTVVATLILVLAGMFAFAGDVAVADENGAPQPIIPESAGDACVADVDFMRRNHMNLLMHERDETMHEGVRGGDASLKGCISCHAVPDEQGVPVTVDSPDHFCRTCHDFAAVKMDCFTCHSSRPEQKAATLLNPHISAKLDDVPKIDWSSKSVSEGEGDNE